MKARNRINHDDEHDWTRLQIMEYISTKPYCLSQKGPEGMKGCGISTAYGRIGKGARIIRLNENQRSFNSWICMEDNKTILSVAYPESFTGK